MAFTFGSGGGFGQQNQQSSTPAFGGFGTNNAGTSKSSFIFESCGIALVAA